MRKLYSAFLVVVFGALAAVPVAMAQTTTPTFNPATDFGPAINTYANGVLDGVLALLPIVLGVAAVITVLALAVRAIRKWIGQKKVTSTV